MCSGCGNTKKDLKFSEPVRKCVCSHEMDRNLNASINLLRYELAV